MLILECWVKLNTRMTYFSILNTYLLTGLLSVIESYFIMTNLYTPPTSQTIHLPFVINRNHTLVQNVIKTSFQKAVLHALLRHLKKLHILNMSLQSQLLTDV